ncbi:hypothetical protein [Streptomyces rhizosphaericus]|uniref:Lipoprotein n=1 Tax=Streptomyces rhizosphaericus TaxID=114699 RepID=A0A6G4AE91_9ACTN|nr:hypothetical protein [Streptomyces rhizosphaericus]NEW71540.1 hypothetical protein [Streptomyces rhizosphaericus]
MNTTTTTNRFRGRAGRRIAAALVAAAALSLGATACGPEDSGADSSGSSSSSASAQPTSGSSSDTSGSQGQHGGQQGHNGGKQGQNGGKGGGNGGGNGGGAANAGNHRIYVGTLKYLAPGKMTIKPESGGMEQAFLVSNATRILGAAAICSDDGGTVSIGDDGYGTSKCTVEQLEKAAKTNSVTVRVTMNPKSGGAETVEEKYHP